MVPDLSSEVNELVILAKGGDVDAFGKLYSFYAKEMYYYACSMVKNSDLAQDAVQEATMFAFKDISNLRNTKSFKGWLFKILNVSCRRYYNMDNSFLSLNEDVCYEEHETSNIIGDIDRTNLSLDLNKALEILTTEEREIVLMKIVNDYKCREIADMLGVPGSTVRSKLRRALIKLRAFMESCGLTDIAS